MDIQSFWNVIGNYNKATFFWQLLIFIILLISLILCKIKKAIWIPLSALALSNLFIGTAFFLYYGSEPIQYFFAAPLFIAVGILFVYEAFRSKNNYIEHFSLTHYLLLSLYLLYPLISYLLGHTFPQIVTHVMPCPIICISIIIYSIYHRKNFILLLLITIWGLTGVKAIIFSAYEDLILLLCGLYCLCIMIKDIKIKKKAI